MVLQHLLDPLRIHMSARLGSQNIAARRRAAGDAWDAHLDASQTFVTEEIADVASGCAVILGSGHLFDVPVQALCTKFDRVVLVDIDHPKVARATARKYSNIELVSCDVTGVTRAALKSARAGHDLPPPKPPRDLLEGADFVVSLNLVSQIPLWPHTFLTRFSDLAPTIIDAYMAGLIENHLDWVCSAPGKSCVIGDVERQFHENGEVNKREDVLFGVTLPTCRKSWLWNIAPAPLAHPHQDLHHKVCAFVCT